MFTACMVLMTTLSPALGLADDAEMIKSIMTLRADVEALYTGIEENKDNYKAQMKSLSLQTADSEAQINRMNTSLKLADQELQKIQDKIAKTSTDNLELRPMLTDAFAMLEKNIRTGIPFKVAERLAALEKIKSDFKAEFITDERALALLWASYEDNIRLTSEIGLFKQKINIDGQDVLAQVAKIGSVMLFFATPDDRVGYAVKDVNGYTYKTVDGKEKRESIVALFDALAKQIRTGYFRIPNALVLTGGTP
jgi:tRNA/tmRNA/rRNA uracil-C5-methylase (TrmA/RlmC/RlmD family)